MKRVVLATVLTLISLGPMAIAFSGTASADSSLRWPMRGTLREVGYQPGQGDHVGRDLDAVDLTSNVPAVFPTAPGTVVYSAFNCDRAGYSGACADVPMPYYGWTVVVSHGRQSNGDGLYSIYTHLSETGLPAPFSSVGYETQIGTMDDSGCSGCGAHLHFAVHRGPDGLSGANALWQANSPVNIRSIIGSTSAGQSGGSSPVTAPGGRFSSEPKYSPSGDATAVFTGGSFDALEAAARAAGAIGAWVQDALGNFRLLLVDGPAFLRDELRRHFPSGSVGSSAVTLRRGSGGLSISPPTPAPAAPTSVLTPAPTQPPRVVQTPVPTPVPVPPAIPTPLSPSGSAIGSGSQVVLMWSGVSGAATYDMEVWGGPYTTTTACSGTAAITCAIGPMWDGGPYFWRVRARNSAGVSAWSSTVSFSVGAAPVVDNIPAGITPPPYRPTHPGQTVSIGGQNFRSDDGKTWIYTHPDKPTSCSPSTNGVMLYRDPDFRTGGGCLFTTADIPNLQPAGYDRGVTSLQFLGSYVGHHQVLIYRQANYQDLCGSYWQDQSDLRNCAGQAMSIQIRPYAAPAPIPTPPGTTLVGNIAPSASLSADAKSAVDGSLGTQWIGGHQFRLTLTWSQPATIRRVVIWDRTQSDSDNSQINTLQLRFSDGSVLAPMDMTSGGPRCIDVTFPPKTVISMTVEPWDASGRNGLREIEVWATTGSQNSSNSCVMKLSR